jgi:hypothetical protein
MVDIMVFWLSSFTVEGKLWGNTVDNGGGIATFAKASNERHAKFMKCGAGEGTTQQKGKL